MNNYLVFDWGGTYLKYALMNSSTEILEQGKVCAPPRTSSREEFLEIIDPIVGKYSSRIEGIAVSSSGIVDSTNGIIRVVGSFPFLERWPLAEEFRKRYGFRTTIENDAKSAALAEIWRGNLSGCESGAVMIIGTSIGGGLVMDGKLRRGRDFFAGEFSCMNMNCSRPADAESYVAELGIYNLYSRIAEHTGEDIHAMKGEDVFRRINDGDAIAVQALHDYTDALALQIFNLNILLDLEKICIGGGVSRQPALMSSLQKSVEKIRTYHPDIVKGMDLPLPDVDVCRFYNEANLIGALYHHLYEKGTRRI